VSTERNWHQDSYLNPDEVGDRYCGVWFALDDISADAGPFEYVPGSHRWAGPSREQTLAMLEPHERADPMWPKTAERFVTDHFEDEIARRGAIPQTFVARRGDVLFWKSGVVHRGSAPKVAGMERRSLICHYSATDRADMPKAEQHDSGGWFFPF
jgi:ectoine hydroxylase-related dioxygenase (phytanoyl-CoA dioxygenase family)